MRALVVFAVAIMFGCGGAKAGSGATTSGPLGTSDANAPDAGLAAPANDDDGGTAAPALLGEDECAQMADHMLDVQIEERQREGQEIPEPGQLDEIRRGIKAELVPQCAGNFDREIYDCWMGAKSHAEFERCAGGPPPPQN